MTQDQAPSDGLDVLVVDDDVATRRLLSSFLTSDGHHVRQAEDGEHAVQAVIEQLPDVVLLDVQMPVMNGYVAAERIKKICGDRFVPVIFLTATTDERALARCIEVGGDDYLIKPFKRSLLRAKIRAMARIRHLTERVHQQGQEIKRHHAYLQNEMATARGVFDKMLRSGALDAPCLRYQMSAASLFNGDLLVAANTPSGGLHVMIGDFTGHGLPAAVGVLPTCDAFYSMTAKGYSVGDIVVELNGKLREMLATGMFCAATLIEIDSAQRTMAIWNGGLPDVLIYGADGKIVRRVPSQRLALGIVEADSHYRATELVRIEPGMRALVCTDGLAEAQNEQGDFYGPEMEQLFDGSLAGSKILDAMLERYTGFIGDTEQLDDITCLELACDLPLLNTTQEAAPVTPQVPADWELKLRLGASALRSVDPMPILMNVVRELPGPGEQRERIYTVLAELFANSLEHGLLDLDSKLKEQAAGFVRFYEERAARLAKLEQGEVEISLRQEDFTEEAKFTVSVRDTGSGFDTGDSGSQLEDSNKHSGRGLALIRRLCDGLAYNEAGTQADATFDWQGTEEPVESS
ncbi:MAG: SpoIIE family protein phosphatase [Planctomycetota bacterium]